MHLAHTHQAAPPAAPDRLLKIDEVEHLVSLGRTSIYAGVRRGDFPAPLSLSPSGARVAWTESSISSWIQSRVAQAAELGAAGRARGPNSRHGNA